MRAEEVLVEKQLPIDGRSGRAEESENGVGEDGRPAEVGLRVACAVGD